jgi:S-adenosylmethionine hydrolase
MGMTENKPVIALMTDFGLADTYVGQMKSVIAARTSASVIDLTHSVAPQNVLHAAYLFSTAHPYLPDGAVIVCIADPGVGTDRSPIAVQWTRGYLVGPDNGWLSYLVRDVSAANAESAETPIPEGWTVAALENPAYQLTPVSRTFHGRDIFAPAAAALAEGTAIEELGPKRDSLVTLAVPMPVDDGGTVRGQVVHVDNFGNLITNIPSAYLGASILVSIAGGEIRGPAQSYQAKPFAALVGSSGVLEIAAPNANAARLLGIGIGAPVSVTNQPRLVTEPPKP